MELNKHIKKTQSPKDQNLRRAYSEYLNRIGAAFMFFVLWNYAKHSYEIHYRDCLTPTTFSEKLSGTD